MHDIPLLAFTCGLEVAVGVLAIVTIASFVDDREGYKTAACVSAACALAAMLASLFHLGVPTRAILAITGFGSSPLSNEIVLVGAFAALAVLYAVLGFLPKVDTRIKKVVAVLGSCVGFASLIAVGIAYANAEVPLWDSMSTYIEPITAALSCGAVIFLALYFKKINSTMMRIAGTIAIAAVVLQVAYAVPDYAGLALGAGAAASSAQVIASSSSALAAGWVLVGAGVSLSAWQVAHGDNVGGVGMAWGAAGALTIGQIIVRFFFYAAMVTTAVGLL
ncbi:dimethyl sulfoxide reductase anchor subunit family protein [Curtanaerobium respiraculi]|uniref:dimethyl sulfoxide reductase anchor subunit family protein n=1 Tax=Curtanaerobium respiraculi TaxID=2949669 RepID=UPI0024B357C7|nr:DmsC/YnfH family molybdoenzyme membrane anchor subunit [Curtanaerobium respiraculi]